MGLCADGTMTGCGFTRPSVMVHARHRLVCVLSLVKVALPDVRVPVELGAAFVDVGHLGLRLLQVTLQQSLVRAVGGHRDVCREVGHEGRLGDQEGRAGPVVLGVAQQLEPADAALDHLHVFALVLDETELGPFRKRLKDAFKDRLLEDEIDPSVVTQLTDIGQVVSFVVPAGGKPGCHCGATNGLNPALLVFMASLWLLARRRARMGARANDR